MTICDKCGCRSTEKYALPQKYSPGRIENIIVDLCPSCQRFVNTAVKLALVYAGPLTRIVIDEMDK